MNEPAPFEHAQDGSFVDRAATGDAAGAHVAMHVARFTADERLIDFDFSAVAAEQPLEGAGMEGVADAVAHEPGGFLGDAEFAVDFVATDTVFAVDNHPGSGEPLIEAEGGVLEDGAGLEGELRTGVLFVAFPAALLGEVADYGGSAVRAADAVRPAVGDHEVVAVFGDAVVDDGLLERFGGYHTQI